MGTKAVRTGRELSGKDIMVTLLLRNVVLISIAIGHLGSMGPMFCNFLFGYTPSTEPYFLDDHANAHKVFKRATKLPCPIGVAVTVGVK